MPAWPTRATGVVAKQLLAQVADAAKVEFVIDGYPEYATDPSSLEPPQRSVLRRAAEMIVRSQSTMRPVRAFVVVGHADKALRKPPAERPSFELQVSQHRARAATEALYKEVLRLSSGAHFAKTMQRGARGVGNTKPRVANAATEADMRKNRRVEILVARSQLTPPQCGTR
jgi:outer membrane protein OmpA-like peptidoglycan-associated protein